MEFVFCDSNYNIEDQHKMDSLVDCIIEPDHSHSRMNLFNDSIYLYYTMKTLMATIIEEICGFVNQMNNKL